MAHACNPSTLKAEAGGLCIQAPIRQLNNLVRLSVSKEKRVRDIVQCKDPSFKLQESKGEIIKVVGWKGGG